MVLASCTLMPVSKVSHDKKSHIGPHFNCLELRFTLVPLTALLASHDANAGANDVIDQTSHVAPYFDCH